MLLKGPLELIKTQQFKKYNILFWFAVAALAYAQDILVYFVVKGYITPGYSTVYLLGWVLWALITPLAVRFSVRFPINSKEFSRNAARHLLFALMIVLSMEFIETVFILSITYLFSDRPITLDMLSAYLIYTFQLRLLIYFLIVAATSAIEYFSKVQHFELQASQLQSKLMEAQLKALKMQIQPHFLFNTHHAIVGLMLKKDIDKAIEMLTLLSDLLRKTLDISEEQFISLEKEFETASLYLEIQRVRFNDRLHISVLAEKKIMGAQVPPFILQPLIENAIMHGFVPQADACTIEVIAEKINERLAIRVMDNGKGLSEFYLQKKGIGVENVQSRLKELFGFDHSFSLTNKEGSKGVIALIEIPYIKEVPIETPSILTESD